MNAAMNRRTFLKRTAAAGLALTIGYSAGCEKQNQPHIVLIMADDMGYSDLGCTGGEIDTPNIDRLAETGVMMTRFYNSARCAPTRASLLTGLYPHQAGMGMMTEGLMTPDSTSIPAYQGYIKSSCPTLAEVLHENGYQTFLSGKWHVGDPEPSRPDHRGFERTFSLIWGASNYFNLEPFITENMEIILEKDGEPIQTSDDFYMTTAITDHALNFLDQRDSEKPFFLYLSYTAPHWPLHALPKDIERYQGKYLRGWDAIRHERYSRMLELGVIPEHWKLSPAFYANDFLTPDWDNLTTEQKQTWDKRMAVYAAQMYRMDAGIGHVMQKLEQKGIADNTIVLFLSDNGACRAAIYAATGWCAERSGPVGSGDSFDSYGASWANVSNTPFRQFKATTYEGGIITPLIISWPDKLPSGRLVDAPGHIIDIMPTLLEAAGAGYPKRFNSNATPSMEGRSLLPLWRGERDAFERDRPLFWEHNENRAVRAGKWKLVYLKEKDTWELYDMQGDGTECTDLADRYPDVVESLKQKYFAWTERVNVIHNTDSLILMRHADWF